MKSNSYTSSRIPALLAATVVIAGSAHAADFTWDGGTGNWNATNWNGLTATGPVSAGNTATINSGNVTVNVGGVASVDSITVTGAQLNLDEDIVYGVYGNITLQGATLNGVNTGNDGYGVSALSGLTVSGSAASSLTGNFFNLGSSPATFSVADATGDANADLNVNSLWDLPGSSSALIKTGAGTMRMNGVNIYSGGTTINEGTVELAGGNDGYGFIKSAVTVNSGATLSLTGGDGTGLGWRDFYKVTSLTINGGTVTAAGTAHVWNLDGGGLNMTGGTLQSNGGVSSPTGGQLEWWQTTVTTNASPDTATIGGRIRIRADGGYGGIPFNVADGAAGTDLLVSAAINQANGTVGITKSGTGTMELSGANSYAGPTTLNAGTLVLSGAGNYTGTVQVNGGTLSLSNAVIDDGAPVVIASGATVNVNFVGSDTVGSLEIDGSGPLPAGLYNNSHGTYGSYFTGGGSLEVLAQDGTWTSNASGNWSDGTKWSGSIIAVGADNTATFNAPNDVTVTLDSNRIIGNLAFNLSNYVLDGGNTLTLDSAAIPSVSVASGLTTSVSAGLAGTDGLDKTGAGTLVLSGVKSYTGGTTVTGGTLELSNTSTFDVSAINGSVTVQSGATLKLSGLDFTGLGKDGARVTYLEVNDATVENTVFSWVNTATVNLTGSTMSGGQYHIISSAFNSSESSNTSTISSNLLIRKDYGSNDLSLDVADGTAATDLLITGNIGDVFAAGLGKSGPGKLVLSGTNTYTGNTVVTDGALEVTSGLRFRPTANTTTNSVSNSGTSTVTFSGTVELDLTAAAVANGNVWDLFNLLSYSGLAPSAVTSTTLGSFTEATPGTWELPVASAKWVFTEVDGNLTYVVTATDYDNWADSFSLVGGPTADDDNDGLTNEEEYAFGLVPNSGSSVNPIAVPFDKTGGTFSYTRRKLALQDPDLNYTVWYSTNLGSWTQDTGATQGTAVPSGDIETVPVTISSGLLTNTKLFIQVRAE